MATSFGRETYTAWLPGTSITDDPARCAIERWAAGGIILSSFATRYLRERIQRALTSDTPLTIAMVDVDRFKSVNDRFTHRIGDRVLKTLAAIMSSEVREQDLPARWAGDEFVILFDDATELTARQICERIKTAVATFDWHSIAPGT